MESSSFDNMSQLETKVVPSFTQKMLKKKIKIGPLTMLLKKSNNAQ